MTVHQTWGVSARWSTPAAAAAAAASRTWPATARRTWSSWEAQPPAAHLLSSGPATRQQPSSSRRPHRCRPMTSSRSARVSVACSHKPASLACSQQVHAVVTALYTRLSYRLLTARLNSLTPCSQHMNWNELNSTCFSVGTFTLHKLHLCCERGVKLRLHRTCCVALPYDRRRPSCMWSNLHTSSEMTSNSCSK